MKNRTLAFAVLLATSASVAALTLAPATASAPAREVTRTFAVGNMTCATCPITVKTAMSRVAGVRTVTVDFAAKTATVTYDPTRANPSTIAAASTNVGCPAKPLT